jgi:hypothetical protein
MRTRDAGIEFVGTGPAEAKEPDAVESQYPVRAKSGQVYDKTLVLFLGRLQRDVPIVVTEHLGYEWFAWNPPHRIQAWTIDRLLGELERFLQAQ